MNILYIGAFPPDFLIKRSGGEIDSLYRDDQAVIKGLKGQEEVNLKTITSPDIASWPHGPLFVHREENKEEEITMVSSLNISIIKQPWTIVSMIRESARFIRQCEGNVVVVIPYIVFRHVATLRLLKWLFPKNVIQAVIVPDFFFPTKWLRKVANDITEKMASHFDAFVLYTEKMAEHLHVAKDHYEVIEGFREVANRVPIPLDVFRVVYAGSLNIRYGVGRLIDAMSFVNDKRVELHLYGTGTAEAKIKEACENDNRIVFHGKVPNSEAVEAIYSASALINPRNANDGDYTEYSFPSKDIEYLSTGIPTLLCKLPGMPQEYYDHFLDMGEGTPQQIADAITRVKQMSPIEREKIGSEARKFIMDRMDCKEQGARIIRLFHRVIDEKLFI